MRETIIASAIGVFNTKGIKNSSLRDIADQLSISDGHLRYYFRTKEDLLLAVFAEMDEAILAVASEKTVHDSIAQAIIEPVSKSFRIMYAYGFFFTEPLAVLQKYTRLYNAYIQLIERRRELFMEVFEKFKENGIFAQQVDKELFPVLFEQFFILSDSWIRYAKMPHRRNIEDSEQVKHYVAVSIGLFLPYLSSQVRDDLTVWVKSSYYLQ
ncbi:TetR/AcrR family transcriptional regulator [Telluribacter sp. SYSU D00476]|uniref:TetR/AcrR family transcriptional regulator n=1 Tax=Telluribacter sp. SYSU D00476 TaxID=2811430 RepID=UPI001FF4178B|nr:TetR/AcrR family transcriptional regulator [Telluribacter sp. SYSU D00476]